ncbi:unnamed protein product [Ceutorhynchus assimilis]|uniref:Uncharacterized protein n=1 Tax=Ceutorhynchus assimilis TaxID=467358 RepID=A0A9N9MRC8_9CUCU|nr:unnamed protein product [Ceutorhynchus assimilis]
MTTEEFLDYKSLADKIRLRVTRKLDSGGNVDWTKIKEVMVNKDDVTVIDIKKSHHDAEYQQLPLQRLPPDVLQKPIPKLNSGQIKLPANKYKDLTDLCTDRIQVVRDKTFKQFFMDLPHDWNN